MAAAGLFMTQSAQACCWPGYCGYGYGCYPGYYVYYRPVAYPAYYYYPAYGYGTCYAAPASYPIYGGNPYAGAPVRNAYSYGRVEQVRPTPGRPVTERSLNYASSSR